MKDALLGTLPPLQRRLPGRRRHRRRPSLRPDLRRSESLKDTRTSGPSGIRARSPTTRPRTGYTVAGSGENMWAARDAFHYVWKKATGDLALTADVSFVGAGTRAASQGVPGDPPGSRCRLGLCRRRSARRRPDVAAISRGQGCCHARGPGQRLGTEAATASRRGGNMFGCTWLRKGRRSSRGPRCASTFEEPFYVGIGVCAHNDDVTEKAVFSNVELTSAVCRRDRAARRLQHARDADDLFDGSARRPRHAHPDRGAQLAARRHDH